jgi:eukaryotic-like serine/threonine-protein kinase
MTDRSEARDPVEELAEEFVARHRRGERPSLSEYTRRYPEHAAAIRTLFPALVKLEQLKPAPLDPTGAPGVRPDPGGGHTLERLGDFCILREVGRGGMGVVYEAEQLSLGRRVALKVLPAHALLDRRHLLRFQREARAAARLHHTNIVPVHGVGECDGLHYYVMQFIRGLGLDQVLAELRRLRGPGGAGASTRTVAGGGDLSAVGVARALLSGHFTTAPAPPEAPPAPPAACDASSVHLPGQFEGSSLSDSGRAYWQSVARIGVQVAEALAYAAGEGVLHRDVKPSNLLLDERGTVWVTDFGLAKADTDTDDLTHTGDVIGTVRYMAPERFNGRGDLRSDICGLGLTLYELLTLQPAYSETERSRLLRQVLHDEPPRPRRVNPRVPRDLETIVLKAIARDPARRYQTPAELAEDLQRFIDDRPIRARRTSWRERLWRLARRNRAVAALTATVALLLVAVAVASSAAAVWFRRAADEAEQAQQKAEDERANAQQAQRREEEAHRKAAITLADMHTSHGLLAADRGDSAQAMLWFANAVRLGQRDPERERANRIRFRTWARGADLPVRAFPHDHKPRDVALRPGAEGHLLVLTEGDRCSVWDVRNEQALPWARGQTPVTAACWGPEGEWLALGLPSGTVEVRRFPGGDVLHRLAHPGAVRALALSPDGRRLALASHVVRIWDCEAGAFTAHAWPHPAPVHALAFSPAGDRLLTSCQDGKARLFAFGDGAEAPLFAPVPDQGRRPVFIDGGRGLVTKTAEREVTWWDAATGRPVRRLPFPGHGNVWRLDPGPGGRSFAASGWGGTQVWDAADGGRPGPFLRQRNWVSGAVYGPGGATVLTMSNDRAVQLWSLPDGRPLGAPLIHTGGIYEAAFSSDGRLLVTAAEDGLVRVWRRPDGYARGEPLAGDPGPVAAALSPDGLHVIRSRWRLWDWAYGWGRTRVFETATGRPAGPDLELAGLLRDAVLAPDGRRALTVCGRGGAGPLSPSASATSAVALGISPGLGPLSVVGALTAADGGFLEGWDFRTGRPAFPAVELHSVPDTLACSPDGSRAAVFCKGGEVLLADAATGRLLLRLDHGAWLDRAGSPPLLRFTPDGSTLVTLGAPPTIQVWDAQTGRRRLPPLRPSGDALAADVSRDGRLLAAGGDGGRLEVWDLADGRRLASLLHPESILDVRFSADGRHVFTACRDGQARLWDWRTGGLGCPPLKEDQEIHGVDLTPDGRFGLTASRTGVARLWDLTTGKPVAPPLVLAADSLTGVRVTPDGHRAVASAHGLLYRFDLADLTAPGEMNAEDLCLLGEVASGYRLHDGNLAGLTTEEWLERWRTFRRRHPEYGTL